ncbi:MFS transporter [Leadbettera azotonutricia]|uniref:Transporter, major facilitator family n=1 Tax=Leadbettera azotonutricia (strain ATCC BAA-888 / DSM 13862 / ZAS-9) TaxID=545695 RepID=F5Y6X0_LEAAZ|nr:MFS transporter [Leadbettera azotonutricia]AEF81200.1 transporter, major facilitator family [Leadbettera azotonutricia ZAS-9]
MSMRTGAFWPVWLTKRRRPLENLFKLLNGKTRWVRRLVSGGSVEADSRKYILVWNGAANIAGNMAGGNFLVGLYAIIHVSDVLLGVLTTLIQFCNIFQILSPLLLNRFKRKKLVLLATRIVYYTFFIVVIGLIPLVPGEDGFRVGLLLAATVFANLINALAAPGYSVLHIRSIPEESRADFFSVLNLLINICIYVFILIGGYVVDFFRSSGSLFAGITAVRIIGLFFAALEIYAHCHVHEFDEPGSEEPGGDPHPRINIFLPLRNKEFMICTLLTGLYSFFANIPGMYYSSYLVNDVVAPFSYLGVVNFLSVPIMLFAIPVWNHIIRNSSWFKTISLSLLLVSFHYFMLPFVSRDNYVYLYTAAMIYYFSIIPGVSIVTSNLPFYKLPEEGRTDFLAFYAGFNSFMAMLGLFCGSVFVAGTGSLKLEVFSFSIGNKQFIMVIAGLLLFSLGILYRFIAKKETEAL